MLRKSILATYRKRAMNARFLFLAEDSKRVNKKQDERVLNLSVHEVADTRLANILHNKEIGIVKELFEIVSVGGWKSILKIEGVGKTSYYRLLSKLHILGVVDESLERLLLGHSASGISVEK